MPVAFYAAWLPRSFTFNALAITAASPPNIRAFGDYLSSSSAAFAEATAPKGEADPPPVDWGAAGFFIIFFTFAVTA
jgi:hypothetical protein